MNKGDLLYTGKAKDVFATEDQNIVWLYFKNDATAFNGVKKESFEKKGKLNLAISTMIFKYLEKNGIKTHFIETISDREQIVKKVNIFPLEVVMRNIVAGSLAKRLGKEEGEIIENPILEFFFKEDALDDPFINDEHIGFLKLATPEELDVIKINARKINELMKKLFLDCGILLVDFKIEFGKTVDGEIVLADEISPDSCRLWDAKTKQKLDKDVFRRDIGNLIEVYEEVLRRLEDYLK